MELLLFTQKNCAPCKELKLFLNNSKVEFEEVNLSEDEHKHFAEEYSIMSTPVTILVEDGEELIRFNGAKRDVKDELLDIADDYGL